MKSILFIILLCTEFLLSYSVRTTKNRDLIWFQGYEYRKKGISADQQTQFWQCPLKHCPGRAHSPVNSEVPTKIVTQHNHPTVETDHVVREKSEEIKRVALNNPVLPSRELNSIVRQGLSDEQLMSMPSSSTVQRQVARLREIPERKRVDASEIHEIIIDILSARLHANHHPTSVMLDFEQSAKNAFLRVWPGIQIRMCLFHLSQSVLRYVQRHGFIQNYENEEFRKFVRSLPALSFIQTATVEPFYDVLLAHAPQETHEIFNYFKRTYIRKNNGNEPIFPVNNWNHHQSVIDDNCRTNNAQEAFHLNLRRKFQNLHPPLSKLITVLKEEERIAQDRVRAYELDPTLGLNIRPRKKQNINNDLAIRALVTQFDLLVNPTPEQIVNHLRSLQYRLASNGFDHWD